ncbi:hypothetical protein BDV25DRAFT_165228 [Aspergillus avenaceus]|uniref:Uncharacterized protein n=1 Tax=Aspergillus avenaceus TaxID=36643 RepID=A0A5N6TFT6_ASPAV|nr:hypothetical protein BDV25DRAFT_165228 [Aspergillus avenaceus]
MDKTQQLTTSPSLSFSPQPQPLKHHQQQQQQQQMNQMNQIPETQNTSQPSQGQISGSGGPTATAPFLRDFSLVAEAAKRAQMSVVMRDLEAVTL